MYDSFVGDSFRVVNNMDVVARMPRGTMGRLLLDYRHAGRTVMVDEDPVEPAWIEGEVCNSDIPGGVFLYIKLLELELLE